MILLLYLLVLLCFLVGVLYLLYIPLPADIADRTQLQAAEIFLRITIEYTGDLVELFFGAIARNTYTRLVMRLGFACTKKKEKGVTITDDCIGNVPVRVYTPSVKKCRAAIVFIHGGGWSTMKSEYYDDVLAGLVRRLGACAFSIDYRLAPEYPYPAGPDDCEAVIKDLHDASYEKYGIDPQRIMLVGDSAGGNLVAVVTQRLEKRQENYIKCQVLIYPVIHVFGFLTPSFQDFYKNFKGTALLNPRVMARWILFYVGQDGNVDDVQKLLRNQHVSEELASSPTFSRLINVSGALSEKETRPKEHTTSKPDPKLGKVFSQLGTNPEICPVFGVTKNLPPAMVLTAGYDILRDEGILYAEQLSKCGVECEANNYPTAYHGIFNMPKSALAAQMKKDVLRFLEKHSA